MPPEIERVARAIYESRNGAGATPWSRRDAAHKAPYFTDALAAMEALLEPSEGMREAGGAVVFSPDGKPKLATPAACLCAHQTWRLMLTRAMGR